MTEDYPTPAADPIRAALERLVELDDTVPHNRPGWIQEWTDGITAARAALAAAPTPPAEGEVAELVVDELVRQLRTKAATEKANRCHYSAILLTRAADLLEQRHPAPVAVSERLPEPNTKVLAHYFNELGKGRTICAIWVPAKSRSDDADFADDDFTEYDEESDTFYWPEGWYEAIENWDDLGWVKVYEGEVAYWQSLPEWPALPLPTHTSENVLGTTPSGSNFDG